MTKIKICCIQNIPETRLAMDAGADILGLVSAMPSGPGPIDDDTIVEIAAFCKGKIETFLLTCETNPEKIIHQHNKFRTDSIQLVDSISESTLQQLRNSLPNTKLVQVIHVKDQTSIDEAIVFSKFADMLLLDSGNPGLSVKILGGTGKTHNWDISREIVKKVDIPVFLAGGLNPENVKNAIEYVGPYGVDVCSRLRENGALNPGMLKKFIREVKGV